MDRNQVTGLVLIAALLIAYAVFFQPPEEEPTNTPANTEVQTPPSETEVATQLPAEIEATPETPTQDTTRADLTEQYGVFASGALGSNRQLVIENTNAKFTFDNKGGRVSAVELKDYLSYDKSPLILFDSETTSQALTVATTKGNINLSDFYYTTSSNNRTVAEGDTTTVTYRLTTTDGNSIDQIYTIPGTGYQIGYELRINGLRNTIIGDYASLAWQSKMKRLEKNLQDSRNKATVKYYTLADDVDELKALSTDPQQEQVSEGIKWASFNYKFFNTGIIADRSFSGALFNTEVPATDSTVVKNAAMNLSIPMNDLYGGAKFSYYFGPNKYKALKKVAPAYEDNVYMGYKMVSWVNKLIIVNLFDFLQKFIGNYGVIIIIMVFIIKLALFPLSRKSYLSMAKMKVLKPELDKLKEKTGGDMQKMQQEQMKLYREMGVNPLSGCIPMLLQMPILFAMFFFFPNSIELRQESFLWATDLSTYDVLINLPFTIPFYGSHVSGFTLLMTISSILYAWSNNQVSTVQGPMKSIGYVMPVIFMFVLNSYSSGLSFYYFLSNIITFGQQALIRRFVDDEKIRQKLEENKKKNANKKKSKFQTRLEEAMKASQEAQKQKQQQKKRR